MYRPGETVHVKAIAPAELLATVKVFPVDAVIVGEPNGFRPAIALSSFGTLDGICLSDSNVRVTIVPMVAR